MTSSKLVAYKSVWLYLLVFLALLLVQISPSSRTDTTAIQAEEAPSDPVRLALNQLLQDERVPDKAWLSNARQWPGNGTASDATRQAMDPLWSLLLQDVELMQPLAPPLMQADRMRKMREQLKPYLSAAHAPSRNLIIQFDKQIEQLLLDIPSGAGAEGQPLTWATLERVAWDMGDIQDTLRSLRRLALDSSIPDSSKPSQRLFIDLSWVFPTAEVREFQNIANRAIQRRWALLYQLEKSRPQPTTSPTVDGTKVSARLSGQVALVLLSLVGVLLLARESHRPSQSTQALDLANQKAQTLEDRCAQLTTALEQLKSNPPAPQESKPAVADLSFVNELPDLRGRLKRIQWRFDSGQSLELAQQDLTVVEDKLREWEEHLKALTAQGPGDRHA